MVLPLKSLIGAASAPPPAKELALAFCEAAPSNGAHLAPQYGTVGDRAVLECGEIRTIEIGFDLVVVHAGEQHLARGTGVKRRWHAEVGHAAHGMQTLDEIDVHAGITRADRQNDCLVHGVANVAHRGRGDIMDVGLAAPYVRESQQLEAEAVFAGLRIAFAVTALDEAAQHAKHRRLGQPYSGHDVAKA